MTTRKPTVLLLALALGAIAAGPALAQAPDCTGISDVSDFDGATVSDFVGNLTAVQVASGLSRPLQVVAPPGDTERIFIVLQNGTIRIVKNGTLLATPFLNITSLTRAPGTGGGDEEGLLSLAFHPDYDTNGWFFVYHTSNTGAQQIVARYTVDAGNPDLADTSTRQEFFTASHPTFSNHNGGGMAFRPSDGHLYIGVGDGGSGCDPGPGLGNAQDLNSRLGKLHRLNVDQFPPTTTGNPFDGGATADDTVWYYGLRNPWRVTFDRIFSSIFIADVGQNSREEINCQKSNAAGGANFGWAIREGNLCPTCGASSALCNSVPAVAPIKDYAGAPRSITGGYVYRGCRMSDLHGTYFYGDYIQGFMESFRTNAACSAGTTISRTADLSMGIGFADLTSWGEDGRGELYYTDRDGQVWKVVPVLDIMEVSGANAIQFLPDTGTWTWEDIEATSSHPITNYKVYRADGDPTGTFECVHQGPANSWVGGDTDTPLANQVYYYVVTALNASGDETRPGNRSDGTARTVNTASVCP